MQSIVRRSIWDETRSWESSWTKSDRAHRFSLSRNAHAAAHVAPSPNPSPAFSQPPLPETAAGAGQALLVRPNASIPHPQSASDTYAGVPDQGMPIPQTAHSPATGEPPISSETSEADLPSSALVLPKDRRTSGASGGLGSLRKEPGPAVVRALGGPGKSTSGANEGVTEKLQGAAMPIGDAVAPAPATSPTSNSSSAQGEAELAYAVKMFKTKWGLAPALLPVGSQLSRADTGVNSPAIGGAFSPADSMAPTLAPAGGPEDADPCATVLGIPKVHVPPYFTRVLLLWHCSGRKGTVANLEGAAITGDRVRARSSRLSAERGEKSLHCEVKVDMVLGNMRVCRMRRPSHPVHLAGLTLRI
jgi:hypothetical protein